MGRLPPDVFTDLDARLAPVDDELRRRYPGDPAAGSPCTPSTSRPTGSARTWSPQWGGDGAGGALDEHPPPPFDPALAARVRGQARPGADRGPADRLRGRLRRAPRRRRGRRRARGGRGAARRPARRRSSGCGASAWRRRPGARAVRTLDVFLDALGPPPPGFVDHPAQGERAGAGRRHGRPVWTAGEGLRAAAGSLRFEIQIETPPAVLGADGTATVARLIAAAGGRCTGLHYGTYDYSAARRHRGGLPEHWTTRRPTTPRRCMQVAAAGTGVRLSRRLDQRAAGRRHRDAVRAAWDAARPAGPALAGARLLPGLGPAPGPAADPVRGHVRVLPRRRAGRRRPAAALPGPPRAAGSSTSRRRPGRWPGSCCAAWTAARSIDGRGRRSTGPHWRAQ